MASEDLTRIVKVSAPYDSEVEAEVVLESVPVWFDLGWQKVDGEDYGQFSDVTPAPADSSPSVDFYKKDKAPETNKTQALPRATVNTPGTGLPGQP